MSKPDYIPAHPLPCWLSSEDVKAAIIRLAETGTDKVACWEMTQAVHGLCSPSIPAGVHIHPCGHCGIIECDGDCPESLALSPVTNEGAGR